MFRSTAVRRVGLLLLIAAGGWYVWRHVHDLAELKNFRWTYLAPLLAVHLTTLACNGWMNRDVIAQFGLRLSARQWYGLAVINALGNYLPLPQAGAALRGAYLKRLHRFDYQRYTAGVLFAYTVSLALTGVAGLVTLAWLTHRGARIAWPAWAVSAALASLFLLATPPVAALFPAARLTRLVEGYRVLTRGGGVLTRLIAVRLILTAVNATGLWLAYASIARPTGFATAAAVSLGTVASGVVNVTPGNAGAAEAAAWGSAATIGASREVAVNAALVTRATAALIIFTLGPLFVSLLRTRPPEQTPTAPANPVLVA